MGDAETLGDPRCVMDVLAGAAGALSSERGAVVVELQSNADDFEPAFDQKGRNDRRIDAARHGDDDAMIGRVAGEIEILRGHDCASSPICQKSASSRAAAAKVAAREAKRPSPPRRANCSSSAASASRARL